MSARLLGGKLLVGFLLILASFAPSRLSAQDRSQDAFRPLTQAMLNDPDPADWLMWRGGYANWGYSPLDQITPDNVNDLRLAWSWAFAPAGPGSTGMQVEPIVYDGVMYIRHANGRYSAHDATTGDMIWEYSRDLPEEITSGDAVFTVHRGRGVFLFEDRLISHSTDGMLFALDPRTGTLVWETEMVDYHAGQQPSGAPVVFNGAIAVPYNCTACKAASWAPLPPPIRILRDENLAETVGPKFLCSSGIAVSTKNKRQDISIGLGRQRVGTVGRHQLLDSSEQLTQSGPTPKKGKTLSDEAWRGIVASQVCSVASRARRRVQDLSTLGLPLGIDPVPDGELDIGRRCL